MTKRCQFLLFCLILTGNVLGQKQKVWLDADTGNEMDDLYAIVRLLREPTIELIGLSSAHFNNADLLVFEQWNGYPAEGLKTVAESQRLNEQILGAMGRLDIPHPIGADRQIGRAWGQQDPRDSPTAQALIKAARAMPPGQKLHVLTIGALTNIATAALLAPDILPKIRCYALGARYETKTKVWSKNEFNIRNDLNAFDYLLDLNGFDLVVMPVETALPLQFDREATCARLDESLESEKILENRWREHFPDNKTWIMWDLALVEAYLRPELAVLTDVHTPPDNRRRKIKAYTRIDHQAMASDFWEALQRKTPERVTPAAAPFAGPLRPHPLNGRYFTDETGKAIYLTGSHTWANFQEIGLPGDPAFNWEGYLDLLQERRHNFIRLWTWEQAQKAAWTQDPIRFSPLPYLTVTDGGREKYDLDQWNEAYFQRLRQRVVEAGRRGIYVSVMLFQGWAMNKTNTPNADPWPFHPFHPENNVNGVGGNVRNHYEDDAALGTLHSLKNGDVLARQEAYARKVIETLNDLDNVLYEILNEGGTKDWQYHFIHFIKETERSLPKQHPVGMTHAVSVSPRMFNEDLWNSPADWISPAKEPQDWMYPGGEFLENYETDPPANAGKKVVIVDTDHLWGHGGTYQWVWKSFLRGLHPIFMDPWQNLAGRLDKDKMTWMFIKGGIAKDDPHYPDWEPIRRSMGYTARYAGRMDLAAMTPRPDLSTTRYCLANPGEEYLVYFPEGGTATLNLRGAPAEYAVEWFIPQLDRAMQGEEALQGGDFQVITAPYASGDAVLYLKRK